jgi:tRNA A-37 threonylcarbamoyl transferase component Bud32
MKRRLVVIDVDGMMELLSATRARGVVNFASVDLPTVLECVIAEVVYKHMSETAAKMGGGARKRVEGSHVSGDKMDYTPAIRRIRAMFKKENVAAGRGCLYSFSDMKIVGMGRAAVVYDGTDNGARMAIKTIYLHPSMSASAIADAVADAEISQKMGAAGVGPAVRDMSWCERDGGVLLIMRMDLIIPGDLVTYSRSMAISKNIVDEVRRKIALMHDMGYAHNDIHAKNVLVSAGGGEVFLTDFGRSRVRTPSSVAADLDMVDRLESLVIRDRLRGRLYAAIKNGKLLSEVRGDASGDKNRIWENPSGLPDIDAVTSIERPPYPPEGAFLAIESKNAR